MSRSGRSDSRGATRDINQPRPGRSDRSRDDALVRHLSLPRGSEREPVVGRSRVYELRGTESRILATVGAFRVVRADDLQPMKSSRDAWNGALRSLADQGLLQSKTLDVNGQSMSVVVLTKAGRDLLATHRAPSDRSQRFHAGLVKPKEVAHDSQIYRLYQAEADRIEAEGGRVTRVVLDYELKGDYQSFLNRPDRPEDVDRQADMEAFAAAAELPIIDGHLELPDLRIEYETADGRLEHRDAELLTQHYSRAQLTGKSASGFSLYRASGAAHGRGGSSRAGGTPLDPHNLEWVQ